MSLFHTISTRRILPRWRDSLRAASSTDFHSLKPSIGRKISLVPVLREQHEQFALHQNIGTAAELLATALLAGKADEASNAATFILDHQEAAPLTLIQLAHSVAGDSQAFHPSIAASGLRIAKTRQLLRLQPDNPVLWSDMARHHASLGDRRHALKCMKTAIGLAPNHRWMLRTYSRFLAHQENPVAAHKLLSGHPRTRQDPWLIAAELACAQVAGRVPSFWRQATDILRLEKHSPLHLSELSTAVAMMELEAGNRRRAKKLVQKGLVSPTENTLAQVFWAKENRHLSDGFGLEDLVRSAEDAYEAKSQLNILNGSLLEAFNSALTWSADEPFAARPCIETAYVASLLDDHDTPTRMAGMVKQIDGRSDPTLELNVIFATLSSGKLSWDKSASEIMRIKRRLLYTISQADGNSYHAAANLGLWYYRFGNPENGRETYQQAIAIAQKSHLIEAAAMAAIFAAREAILASDPTSTAALGQAKDLVAKAKNMAAEFYLRKIETLASKPEDASSILNPVSAHEFLAERKPKGKPFRVEKKSDGKVILWVPE